MENVADIYPLAPAQAGILYHVLRDNDPELYFEQYRANVVGDVTVDQMSAAWQTVVNRHSALRSIIVWQGLDQPLQVVRKHVDVEVAVVAVDATNPATQRATLDELAAAERAAGIDLSRAPLTRVTVATLPDGGLHLIWNFHHILVDGWSVGVVVDELLTLLDGAELEAPAPLFKRHIQWIKQQSISMDRWDSLVGDLAEVTTVDLPGGTGAKEFERKRIDVPVSTATTDQVAAAARDHRVTVNTMVQAAWAMTLARYSDSDDVTFGVTMSGRPAEVIGIDEMVGMFLATLPMRLQVPADRSLGDWLADIHDQQLDLLTDQHVSLAEVQRRTQLPSGVEMFDSVLVFENWPERTTKHRVTLEAKQVVEQSHYPLTLMVGVGATLDLILLYDGSRFGEQAVLRMANHFVSTLEALAADARLVPGRHDILSAADRDRQLTEWNQTDAAEPDETLAEVWQRQVDADPTAIALIDGTDSWTRDELDSRAAVVAEGLRALGVSEGEPVGICMHRCGESVAAVLGIVKAGAAYVPLDPIYPTGRLELILDDVGMKTVLVHERTTDRLDHPGIVDIDELGGHADPIVTSASANAPEHRGLLYITYTSGSTGVPKGVMGHHAGVLSRCRWQWDAYPFEPDEVVAHKVTLNYADHLWELWGGLLGGAPVLLIPEDVANDGVGLVAVLERHAIRRIVLTPSFVEALLDSMPDLAERLSALKTLTLSGEGVSAELVERVVAELPHVVPLNFYGMSEATVDATTYDARDGVVSNTFPIGKPIRNQRVYVLDSHMRLLPEGAIGRIHVSGVGLAIGYWQRPDLTAECFFDHPFRPDERLYNTGDLGRWLPGGYLEYHGRTDHQIKIRGNRLELGDVEATLESTPGLSSCVAVAIEGALAADRRLVLFVRAADACTDSDALVEAIRANARTMLPLYMIPSRIVVLDEVPTTPNGKTDRRALIELFEADDAASDVVVEAKNPDEQAMVEIWRGLLGPRIHAASDFFDSGGHSLLALRLVSRIGKAFGADVVLPDLLEHSTPRALVANIRRPDRDHARAHLVEMAGNGTDGTPFYCVHGAGGNVLRFSEIAKRIGCHRPFVAIQALGADGKTAPHETVEAMAEAYVAELVAAQPFGPFVLGGYSAGGAIAYDVARQLIELDREVLGVVLLDTYHPDVVPIAKSKWRKAADLVSFGPAAAVDRVRHHREWTGRRAAWDEASEHGTEITEVPDDLRFARLTKAIGSAYRQYKPERLDVPLVIVGARNVSSTLAHASRERGWEVVSDSIRVIEVPGDHHNLLSGEMAEHAAEAIEYAIDVLSAGMA